MSDLHATPAGAHHLRQTCRGCGSRDLHRFLELGPTPLANSFLRSEEQFAGEHSYPLDVYFCATCTLVQLLDVIDPEVLFRDYIYVSGTSETMAVHFEGYAASVVELLDLSGDDLVVEAASNDGSLLSFFKSHGVGVLGVEPARNVAEKARAAGVDTMDVFFDSHMAEQIRTTRGAARAVVANNVLAHVDDTRDFLRGCRLLLHDDGLVIVEVPYLRMLLEHLEYDTIYHEHLCYFSVASLCRLFESVDLSITRVDLVPVHGGSLRVFAGPARGDASHGGEVLRMVDAEQGLGMDGIDRYRSFADDVAHNRHALRELLHGLTNAGESIAGDGAPAKGNTLLNYCGLGPEIIPYIVDRNPLKVGTFTPGRHIPVLPVSTLDERKPDYVLILAWNFADEIMRQQRLYEQRGGRFILPAPEARVVQP
jgi:hypothetical protein